MNSLTFIFSALLSLASLQLVAQPRLITGTWRLQAEKSVDIMGPSSRSRFDTQSSNTKERAIKAMNGREFAFSKDGGVAVKWTAGSEQRVSKGTWLIDKQSGDLLITIGKATTAYRCAFPSEAVLILRVKQQKGFFDALFLEKIN